MLFDKPYIMQRFYKKILFFLFFIFNFSSCKINNNLIATHRTIPFEFSKPPYIQNWVAGVKGGGSGVNIHIPVKDLLNTTPDSIYFRGKSTKAIFINDNIIGRFSSEVNQLEGETLSKHKLIEAKNDFNSTTQSRFLNLILQDNECILTFRVRNRLYYHKISSLLQLDAIPYSSPPEPR